MTARSELPLLPIIEGAWGAKPRSARKPPPLKLESIFMHHKHAQGDQMHVIHTSVVMSGDFMRCPSTRSPRLSA